jgi:hypothetical protein
VKLSAYRAYQSSGIFLNDDINTVKSAYDSVLTGEHDPSLCVEDVARYVLKMYNRGIVDPGKLHEMSALYFRMRRAGQRRA